RAGRTPSARAASDAGGVSGGSAVGIAAITVAQGSWSGCLFQPLQLFDRAAIFDEILRAGVDRRLQGFRRLRPVLPDQVPLADIELRLAFLRRCFCCRLGLLQRLLAEIELDDRKGPLGGLELARRLAEL